MGPAPTGQGRRRRRIREDHSQSGEMGARCVEVVGEPQKPQITQPASLPSLVTCCSSHSHVTVISDASIPIKHKNNTVSMTLMCDLSSCQPLEHDASTTRPLHIILLHKASRRVRIRCGKLQFNHKVPDRRDLTQRHHPDDELHNHQCDLQGIHQLLASRSRILPIFRAFHSEATPLRSGETGYHRSCRITREESQDRRSQWHE